MEERRRFPYSQMGVVANLFDPNLGGRVDALNSFIAPQLLN